MFKRPFLEKFKASYHNWFLCFKIKSTDDKILYLTDNSERVTIEGIVYLPNSGLEFVKGEFDETGLNKVLLKGFYEEGGVDRDIDFLNCEVSILICIPGSEILAYMTQDWMKYYCSYQSINGQSFELVLEPISTKYGQQIVNLYGKTCRANLGDARCGIDLSSSEDKVCDKSYSMCCNKYKNAINFRGEPFLPTYGYFDYNDE